MSLRSSYQKLSRPCRKLIALGVFACFSSFAWRLIIYPMLTRQLIDAVTNGKISDVRRLLRWGANPNQSKAIIFWECEDTFCSSTALDVAAHQGRTDIVRLFLDKGAAINHRDQGGATVLTSALYHGPSDTIILLLARGADVHVCDTSGNTMLHTGVSGHIGRQLELFCHRGIDINARNHVGCTAVEYAVMDNAVEETRILLENGADWKHCSSKNACVWLNAAQGGRTRILKILMQHGADANAPIHGTTALFMAASNNHVEATRFLLEHGANPTIKDEAGHTLFASIQYPKTPDNSPDSKRKRNEIIMLLREAGAK